jgi:FkbM family methyltransferase
MLQKIRRRLGRRSFALNDLDLLLRPYLPEKPGFFVEAGANNGLRQSNSLYFEKYCGWRGLLIEPIPELAEECRRNRPRALVENCALVSCDYPHERIEMRYCNLMSLVKGGMKSEGDEEAHLNSGRRFLTDGEEVYTIAVPAKTLSAVLDTHRVAHVDVLFLDVEGYEANVLGGLDFARHRPDRMLIEVRSRAEIEQIIERWYRPVAVLNSELNYEDILYECRS